MPFSAFFPAGKADVSLVHRLTSQANLQGLLRGAVGGLQQVMRRGSFVNPASVSNATRHFRMEADPMRGFIEDRVVGDEWNFVPRTDVYNAYTVWAGLNGFQPMSAQRFYEAFVATCVEGINNVVNSRTRNGVRGILGIRLK